jgi:hypothetical protein
MNDGRRKYLVTSDRATQIAMLEGEVEKLRAVDTAAHRVLALRKVLAAQPRETVCTCDDHLLDTDDGYWPDCSVHGPTPGD